MVLGNPFSKFKRPGTNRCGEEILAQPFDRLGRDHHPGSVRQHREERGVGLGKADADGAGIDDIDAGDRLQLTLADAIRGAAKPFEVPGHRLGGHFFPVMEGDIASQLDGQRPAIL